MKKNLTTIFVALGFYVTSLAQTITTGPSSSQSPYLSPALPGYSITSVLTATDVVGTYTMSGLADGTGAYDNNDGTFTFLIAHELGNSLGSVRAHGSIGAFVSKWVINKTTYSVVSGADLIQNVNLWNPSSSTYSTYNSSNTSTLAAFNRFCSADLPEVSAFYNSYSGRGTQNRIFMTGEEAGSEGRAFAHIASGTAAGTSYELPYLGKFSMENLLACPNRNDKTIVIGTDDATPGQVYVYVGNKSTTGTDIAKAGLVGGILYGVAVAGLTTEVSGSFLSPNTTFSLLPCPNVQAITGASLNTLSNNLGITNFLRPEDGSWDPSNPRDFYFATTNSFANPSRLYRLRFNDINNPELGGTITAVLDGTEGQKMMDNITIDHSGHIMLQEDVGNNAHNGKIWEYTIATDALVMVAQHDATRFLTGGANFLTEDEESSGIIDVQNILGPGAFLFVDQGHYAIPAPVVEGGQILILKSANTATSNPEINIQGNSVNIPLGNTTISAGNNTDFGTLNTGNSQAKAFVIQNTGTGTLVISSIVMSGTNAGDFTFGGLPAFPINIAPGASQTFTVNFTPAIVGVRNATININNNDYSESLYDYAIQGTGAAPEINLQGNNVTITDGSNSISTTNNTDFGAVIFNTAVTKVFAIQNLGTGTLTVSGITISGSGASAFTILNAPTFPLSLSGSASQTFAVQYLSTSPATHQATITINNSDADESSYDFAVQGISVMDVGVIQNEKKAHLISLFPNPASDEATIKFYLETNDHLILNVFDLQGKQVLPTYEKDFEQGEQLIKINTSSLNEGLYFISTSSKRNSEYIKLTLTR